MTVGAIAVGGGETMRCVTSWVLFEVLLFVLLFSVVVSEVTF